MKTDVLIIGAGGAGLTTALSAYENGATVKILTKEYPTRSQTSMAQGGINASLDRDDSIQLHKEDTLKSSHHLAKKEVVEFFCQEAPNAIEWLDSIGVVFSRTQEGKIAQRKLGGASFSRACYAQDYTGLKILHTLYDQCLAKDIEILSQRYLLEILTQNNQAYGVNVLNIKTGEVETHYAKSIVIATGGYAQIYHKYTTNSNASTGDGIAVALRAGAKLADMEFVQFHPTALKNSSVLISESARGAGGYLLNSKGERFTKELAPRDEVARAIDKEIKKGEDIFLDIRHLGEDFLNESLPQERKLAKLYENIDPLTQPIPIKPVAHYTMGGILVDKEGQTNIKGLYAVGECANHKVHGANRLGGNSLLELVVFGRHIGKSIASCIVNDVPPIEKKSTLLDEIKSYTNEIDFYQVKEELGALFYHNVGIIREEKSLQEALEKVKYFLNNKHKMGVSDTSKIYNTNLVEFLEFINMLELAKAILLGAIYRKESRGAHFRSDYPNEDKKYQKHSVIFQKEKNEYGVEYED